MVERVPPAPDLDGAGRDGDAVPRQQAHDAAQRRFVAGFGRHRIVEGACERRRVFAGVEALEREKRFQLRREGETPRVSGEIERFDPKAVARDEQPPLPRVPQRERPHPVEAELAVCAPAIVGGRDHFGIALRREPVSGAFEFGPQLDEVVELAVERRPIAAAGGAHRLAAALGGIENRKPPVAERERGALVDERPFAVRPAVREGAREPLDGRRRDGLAVPVPNPGYPAHGPLPKAPEAVPAPGGTRIPSLAAKSGALRRGAFRFIRSRLFALPIEALRAISEESLSDNVRTLR